MPQPPGAVIISTFAHLKPLLRRVVLRVHPDVVASLPPHCAPANAASLQTLFRFFDVLRARLPEEVLPEVDAMRVTGLTPAVVTQGLGEAELADRIASATGDASLCLCGYNSVRFDDEFLRFTFYRSLLEPYGRERRGGTHRLRHGRRGGLAGQRVGLHQEPQAALLLHHPPMSA